MYQSMVDIQPATAEIRRGKKEDGRRRRQKLQGKNVMAALLHRAVIMTSFTYYIASQLIMISIR